MKFIAQIKTISIKQLVSGDYSLQVTLAKDNPTKELLDHLNEVNSTEGVVVEIGKDV